MNIEFLMVTNEIGQDNLYYLQRKLAAAFAHPNPLANSHDQPQFSRHVIRSSEAAYFSSRELIFFHNSAEVAVFYNPNSDKNMRHACTLYATAKKSAGIEVACYYIGKDRNNSGVIRQHGVKFLEYTDKQLALDNIAQTIIDDIKNTVVAAAHTAATARRRTRR